MMFFDKFSKDDPKDFFDGPTLALRASGRYVSQLAFARPRLAAGLACCAGHCSTSLGQTNPPDFFLCVETFVLVRYLHQVRNR